jgi:hypothetical protein
VSIDLAQMSMDMQSKKQIYKALVWKPEPDISGKQVTVIAESLELARLKLEEKYGQGSVFDLHREVDLSNAE